MVKVKREVKNRSQNFDAVKIKPEIKESLTKFEYFKQPVSTQAASLKKPINEHSDQMKPPQAFLDHELVCYNNPSWLVSKEDFIMLIQRCKD